QRGKVSLDQGEDLPRTSQDGLELGDQLDRRRVFLVDLVAFQAGEPAELHLEDRLGLRLGQPESFAQLADEQQLLPLVRTDKLDDRVDVVVRDLEALEDVRALLRLRE